jgi:RimJ/RimL family protein N-acetyltransferase
MPAVNLGPSVLSEFLEHERTRPVYAHVAVHNRGSIRVLEKCGFRRNGDATKTPGGIDEYSFRAGHVTVQGDPRVGRTFCSSSRRVVERQVCRL